MLLISNNNNNANNNNIEYYYYYLSTAYVLCVRPDRLTLIGSVFQSLLKCTNHNWPLARHYDYPINMRIYIQLKPNNNICINPFVTRYLV